ncbi:PREDICTED: G2/mitotic-specific cyclin-B3 isoform X2 [Chinchilla lanigera]|uniref:G2/mitotic-specific cyclin-B3 isoform X2 n=1 Tax=Chinchilla lanigera TaxID=34839 RepID=UPI00038E9BFA|nr:PREDICTED: G2/mitotic-specific cyclin-B3 isoform X2 [Chinchilla lanigera]
MPRPPQQFKPETKKFQSTEIVRSDHGQSKKMRENYHVKISPSSPQGTLKKRSAFEDLTNAFQSEPVQSKKEANKEIVKDVPKTIKRRKRGLELAKYAERRIKKYKVELLPVVSSTPSAPNVLEKTYLLDISTNSETSTDDELLFVKRPLLLKEESSTEETTFIKKSLKKCRNPRESSLLEKSLSLQEESDDEDFVIEPVTFGKKHKPKEAVIPKKTPSFKKMGTYQGKQSCLEELTIVEESDVEEDSLSMELMNLTKKPKTEESSSTKKPLPLSNKHTTIEKTSNMIKPVLLRKITSEEELITKEPSALLRESTASKESLSWKPSALREKHTTEQENHILKKSLTLQEKTDFKENSLSKDIRTFKQKLITKEATRPKSPVFGKEESTIQRKIHTIQGKKSITYGMPSHFKTSLEVQEVISGEKSLSAKPLSFKRNPITEFCQEPSTLQEKHATQAEVDLLQKPWTLQKNINREKCHMTTKASYRRKSLPLKKKQKVQKKLSRYKPLLLERVTYGEDSLTQEPLSFETYTIEDSLSPETYLLQVDDSTPEEVSTLKKPVALQKSPTEKEFCFQESLAFQKQYNVEKVTPSKKHLPLKKKQHTTPERLSRLKKPVVLQTVTSEEKSPVKEPPSFKEENTTLKEKQLLWIDLSDWEDIIARDKNSISVKPVSSTKKYTTKKAVPTKMPPSLKKKQTTQGKTTFAEESLCKKVLPSEKKPTTKEEPSALKEKHTAFQEVSLSRKPIALHEKSTTKEESCSEEPVTLKEKPITEEEFLFQELFSSPVKPTNKEETDMEKDSLEKPLDLREKSTMAEESCSKEPVTLKKPITEEEFFSQELFSSPFKPTYVEETDTKAKDSLEKPLDLHEKSTVAEKSCSEEPVTLKKPIAEEEFSQELFSSPFKSTNEEETDVVKDSLEKPLDLHEKSTMAEESCSEEPVTLKKPITEEEFFSPELFSPFKPTNEEETDTEEKDSLEKPLDLHENSTMAEESHFNKLSVLKKEPSAKEATITEKQLPIKNKPTAQEQAFLSKEQFILQEEPSPEIEAVIKALLALRKRPNPEKEAVLKEPLVFQENITNNEGFLIKEPLALQEHVANKKPLFKPALTMQEKPSTQKAAVLKEHTTDTEAHFQELLAMREKPNIEKEPVFQEPLNLQEQPTVEGGAIFTEPLALQEKAGLESEAMLKEPLALQEQPSLETEAIVNELLPLQEKPNPEKEAVLKEPLVFQENITNNEGFLIKEPLALQENVANKKFLFKQALSMQKKPSPALEAILMELLDLKENPNTEKEAVLKEPLVFRKKSSTEDEVLSKKPLALQEKSTINTAFLCKEVLALNEKSTTGNELSFQEPLILKENPTNKEDTFPKTSLILENILHVSSNAVESRTGKFSAANMSSVGESHASEPASKIPFSSQSRTQMEMTKQEDTDKKYRDPSFSSVYAKDVFCYLKDREEKFILKKYMTKQTEITSDMRAILVDWLVEVQMSFDLCHETLYLAVKLVDHYLMKALCKKSKLQLLGSTAFLIAAKFEEPIPPSVDDFLYVCEDMYQRQEMLAMEMKILRTLQFDISIPVAYHFLRRYAMCLEVSMTTLTLSRFICEMTLQKYDYVHIRASKLAAASFLLALHMKKLKNYAPLLEFYSGYTTFELYPLVRRLNILLTLHYCDTLKTVYTKYSQKTYFEVTKIPPLDMRILDEILTW